MNPGRYRIELNGSTFSLCALYKRYNDSIRVISFQSSVNIDRQRINQENRSATIIIFGLNFDRKS